jgi:hypothetical protein
MVQEFTIRADVIESMTLGDIEDFEELGQVPFGNLIVQENLTFRALRALVFVLRRRHEPGLAFDDLREMTVSDLAAYLETLKAAPLGKLEPVGNARRARASA